MQPVGMNEAIVKRHEWELKSQATFFLGGRGWGGYTKFLRGKQGALCQEGEEADARPGTMPFERVKREC